MQRLRVASERLVQAWAFTAKLAPEAGVLGACAGSVVGGVAFMKDYPPRDAFSQMPLGMGVGTCFGCAGLMFVAAA